MPDSILHVSEAFGGGIVSSLYSFATNSSSFQHHLLISEREDQPLSKNLAEKFASITYMRRDIVGAIVDIRKKVSELNPNFVHLHSSYAGVFGRLAGLDPKRVIYSPHGFPFERRSSPVMLRALYYAIEKVLSKRALNFAGVSLHEVQCAKKMRKQVKAVFVPNTSDIGVRAEASTYSGTLPVKVACAGRLCPQKDPAFLIRTIEALSPDVRQMLSITWIGSGDSLMEERLSIIGVKVTGWIPHDQAARELEACDLYFHVAAWEGFPMTVIEAAVLNKPILLRNISAYDGFKLPTEALIDDPSQAAERLESWVNGDAGRRGPMLLARKVRDITSVDRQRKALEELYGTSVA